MDSIVREREAEVEAYKGRLKGVVEDLEILGRICGRRVEVELADEVSLGGVGGRANGVGFTFPGGTVVEDSRGFDPGVLPDYPTDITGIQVLNIRPTKSDSSVSKVSDGLLPSRLQGAPARR